MAADFTVQFLVNRTSGAYQINITDTSTGFVLTKANTKITYPDGFVIENSDFNSPDISAPSGSVSKTLRLDSENKPRKGSYTILFTAIDNGNNTHTEEKTFNFQWEEPSPSITNTSDVALPEVKFLDSTTGYDQTNFTEAITTRQIDADFPSTSALNGSSLTESNTSNFNSLELDMVSSTNYYEGIYNPVLSIDITYTFTSSYLTVRWVESETTQFDVRRTRTEVELYGLLNDFKDSVDFYKTRNIEQHQRQNERYELAESLLSHLNGRAKNGLSDGSQGILDEFLSIVDTSGGSYTYQSTPISAYGSVFAGITGSGTSNKVSKFTSATTIAPSIISDDGATVDVDGNFTIQGNNPLARANHTGTQLASTISDFDTEVSNNSTVAAKLDSVVAGSNISVDNTDPNNPVISSAATVGVQGVTGDGVDNTDIQNPIISYPSPSDIGAVSGSGTTNVMPKFTSGAEIGDSSITDDGLSVSTGILLTISKSGQAILLNGSNPYIDWGGNAYAQSDSGVFRLQHTSNLKLRIGSTDILEVTSSGVSIPSGTLGGYLDTSLGTNATALDADSVRELNVTAATYTASTTLTFSNVSNLRRFTMQLTNTNANVLTFSGVTLYFKSDDLPSGVSFATNALTFPADTAVKYNLVAEKFDGSTFDCKIEIR